MGDLAYRMLDRHSLVLDSGESPDSNDHVAMRLYTLSLSIAAGTSQIQKNIVAERVLGLPKGDR